MTTQITISQEDKDTAKTAKPLHYRKITKTENGYKDERFESISLEYIKGENGYKYVISQGTETIESRCCALKEIQKMGILIIGNLKVSQVVETVEVEDEEWLCSCGGEIDEEDGECIQCGKRHY